jgi:hypothetical protein
VTSNATISATATTNPGGLTPAELAAAGFSFTGGQPGSSPLEQRVPITQPMMIPLTAIAGASQKTAAVYVIEPDIDFQGIEEEWQNPSNNEENPGGFICVNDNDNAGGMSAGAGNGIPDINDPTPLSFDDSELLPISLSITPKPPIGILSLVVPGNLRVWADQKKNPTPTSWDLADPMVVLPTTLYIEGFSPAATSDLILRYTGPVTCQDKVIITSLKTIFNINYSTFIPGDHVTGLFEFCLDGMNPHFLVFNGNNRGFDPSPTSSFKTRQLVTIITDERCDPDGLVSKENVPSEFTKSYAPPALDDGVINAADDDALGDA